MAHHRPQRGLGERGVAGAQAMVLELARHQEASRDLELLVLAVARHLDHLEALLERVRQQLEIVRAQDQHGVREVERQPEVAIDEPGAGLTIQQLEQQLHHREAALAQQAVDAVDHEHWVAHAALAQRAQDLARLGGRRAALDPGQLVGIGRSGYGNAGERALEGARDRGAERRLAGPRRADETQRRSRQIGLQAAHGEVLEDPLLRLGEPQVLAMQHGLDAAQIGILLCGLFPRQRPQILEVGTHLRGFGCSRGQAAQPIHLALGDARDRERQRLCGRGRGERGLAIGADVGGAGGGRGGAQAPTSRSGAGSHRSGHGCLSLVMSRTDVAALQRPIERRGPQGKTKASPRPRAGPVAPAATCRCNLLRER